eukprot:719053-Amphidinium_carterae.1
MRSQTCSFLLQFWSSPETTASPQVRCLLSSFASCRRPPPPPPPPHPPPLLPPLLPPLPQSWFQILQGHAWHPALWRLWRDTEGQINALSHLPIEKPADQSPLSSADREALARAVGAASQQSTAATLSSSSRAQEPHRFGVLRPMCARTAWCNKGGVTASNEPNYRKHLTNYNSVQGTIRPITVTVA